MQFSRYLLLSFLFSPFLGGCDSETKEPSDEAAESNDTTDSVSVEECPSDDLVGGRAVALSFDDGEAPVPQQGALPSTGTYDITSWTRFGEDDGSERTLSATYRFKPGNAVDAVVGGQAGSLRWSLNGTNLMMEATCPESLKGAPIAFQYTFADERMTLFSDDGVMVFEKRTP